MATLAMYCATDVGGVRKVNQDSVAIFPNMNLAVIADGMGGHKAGEVASRTAIEVVRDAVIDGVNLEDAVRFANSQVHELSNAVVDYSGMGTTLIAAQYDGFQATIVHVGDSRLYRFRDKELSQITVDQTLAQQMRDQNVKERNGKPASAYEHVLVNAIGMLPECKLVMIEEQMQAGDLHLLCSDGISGILSDRFITECLTLHSEAHEGAIQVMIDTALRRTAPDNISIAIVYASD